ncbi:MAG: hypothetical protein WD708_07870, partial [Kiritimatiellia bacterium]
MHPIPRTSHKEKITIRLLHVFLMCMTVGIPPVIAAEPEGREDVGFGKMTASVALLRAEAREEDRLLVPPHYQRKREVKERIEVVQKGRYEMVDVRKPVYETYDTVGSQTKEYESTIGKQRKRRVAGYETVKEKRFIPDPDGPDSRVITRPVYTGEQNRAEKPTLYNGFFGGNGLALDTFVRLGIPPGEDEFSQSIHALTTFIDAFGLPDTTFDLAWLAIGFSAVAQHDDSYAPLASRCVNKLLLGQQQDPAVAGMWGPVCVNPSLLAKAVEEKRDLYSRELARLVERHEAEADPGRKEKLQEKINEKEPLFRAFTKQVEDISAHGFSLGNPERTTLMKSDEGLSTYSGTLLDEARYNGLPVNVYGEQIVDLRSTATALYALSVAAERGLLPAKPDIPADSRNQPLITFPPTAQIVTNAAKAVARLQQPDGRWPEGTQWVRVTDFAVLVTGSDVLEELPAASPGESTPASCLYGASALVSAASILHQDPRTLSARLEAASKHFLPVLEAWISGEDSASVGGFSLGGVELMLLLEPMASLDGPVSDILPRAVGHLLTQWDPLPEDQRSYARFYPPAQRELQLFRQRRAHEAKNKTSGAGKEFDSERALRGAVYKDAWFFHDRQRIPSLMALRVLSYRETPAITGAWSWNGAPPRTARLEPVLRVLEEERKTDYKLKLLPPGVSAEDLRGLAVIFVSGDGEFQPNDPSATDALKKRVDAGAVLVSEAPATDEGMAFLKGLASSVFGDNAGMTEVEAGDHRALGIEREGFTRALFLPIGSKSEQIPLAHTPADVSRILYEVLKKHPLAEEEAFIDWEA